MRKPGLIQGVRRHQRYGQTALDVGRTLDPAYTLGSEEDESEMLAFLGTCQSCGAYWDVRHYKTCPARRDGVRCDGYLG